MSLELAKLEKVVDGDNGAKRARCPACAENGHDRKGEHLQIYENGKFGCCAHPRDPQHRKRIFALAGIRDASPEPTMLRVRVASRAASTVIHRDIFKRLGALDANRIVGPPRQAELGKGGE